MVGEGESADAYHITASHPEGLGAKLVMERALADANLKPEDIDYINVHGTSTHVGDISEAKAIKAVFGDAAYRAQHQFYQVNDWSPPRCSWCSRGYGLCS